VQRNIKVFIYVALTPIWNGSCQANGKCTHVLSMARIAITARPARTL